MDRFDGYIKELLYERGINEHDKKELEFEIKDHLMLLKNEYIDKGLSEKDAIKLSIKDFGESNSIGNDIKNNLPSHNKYIDFMFRERAQCLLYMFLLYFLFIFSCATFLNKSFNSIFFYIGMAIVVILTSFIFVNKKVNNDKNKMKNIISINIQFFIIEKIVMSLFFIAAVTIRGGTDLPLINFYIFNWVYIVGFILLTLSSVIITKYTVTKVFHNIKNNYNNTIITTTLFSISILFIIIYYLIPNRFYVLRKIIISMIGSDITNVTRHLFFIVINNSFIIPNIGLIVLIILCIRLALNIKKKGIASIL